LEHLVGSGRDVHGLLDGIGRHADKLAKHELVAQMLQVPFHIRRGSDALHEFKDIFAAARLLQPAHLLELSREGKHVNGGSGAIELPHRPPYQLMAFQVEKVIVRNNIDDRSHDIRIAQDSTQQITFGLAVHGDLATFETSTFVYKFRHSNTSEI